MPKPTSPPASKPTATTPQTTPASGAPPGSPPPGAPAASAAAPPKAGGPLPAEPAAALAKTFRGLDEDLAEFATGGPPPAAAPAEKPAAPAAGEDPAVGVSDTAKAKSDAAKAAADEADDYLMGAAKPPPPKAAEEGAVEGEGAKSETATGPLKAPELRAEYARVKKRMQDLEKEVEELKTKPADTKPIEDTERKTYVEEIAGLKKQVDDMTAALKVVAYEQSPEYRERYEAPFVEAWQEGVQLVSGLTVTDQEGNTRKGTAEDFQLVMSEPVNEKAAELANEMFGANAFYVLAQRRDIMKLNNQRVKALESHKANLSQREKEQTEQSKKQQEEREARRIQNVATFKKLNAQALEKYPEYFAPIPGDDQGNAILERGFRDADLAFSGSPDLPEEKRIQLHSAIRNRAAAFGRLVHLLRQRDTKIAELTKQLEEINGSTPGSGQVGRPGSETPRQLTADEEIELAATQNR